jgi:hypothetical protein
MSAYRFAIDLTITAITRRSRRFRNQVLAVVVIGATALYMLWPPIGLFALVPVCGFFLWCDARQVTEWRSEILAMWARQDIDLLAFDHAIRANKFLPESTLNGMLGLLGPSPIGIGEREATTATRQAVAAVVGFSDALDSRYFAVKIGACAIASAGASWAVVVHAWRPLGLAAVILLLPLIGRWLRASLQRRSRVAVLVARQARGFDADAFCRLMERFFPGSGHASASRWAGFDAPGWQANGIPLKARLPTRPPE